VLEHAGAGHDESDVPVTPGRPAVPVIRTHAAVWTWLALGVAFAVLGTLLLVKVIGGDDTVQTALQPTSPEVFQEVTSVPASVSNAVGVDSPTVPVQPPLVLAGQPPLRARTDGGARLPVVLYLGTEYCSFCAAERWPLIVALSRFGHFDTLFDMQSSPLDFAPDTPTFSFLDTTYQSPYLVFRPFEVESDVLGPHGYASLMTVPRDVHRVLVRFDPTSTYPFVDVANRVVALQAAISPVTLTGLTRDQVASGLSRSSSAVTQAILAAANELTASICAADGAKPASVCHSIGVLEADSVLRLRR
jgi:Domain of unknown function (DUF929)